MKFSVDPKIIEKFPSLNLGVIIAKGLNNSGSSDKIASQLSEIQKEIREKHSSESLPQLPKIDVWRKAYSSFGAKPKENRSSVENLYKLVLQGKEIRYVNRIVDIYNFVSLKYMLPVGGEDLDKIQGDITLTFATENENPVTLLGDKEARPPHPGEVIYKDDISAICRRWNWREADRTKLTENTKNCILVIEGLDPAVKSEIENATKELEDLIQKSCGGNLVSKVLDRDCLETKIQ